MRGRWCWSRRREAERQRGRGNCSTEAESQRGRILPLLLLLRTLSRGAGWKEGCAGGGEVAEGLPPTGIVIQPPSADLFSKDPLSTLDLEQVAATISECDRCRLCESRTNTVPGEGSIDARLVVVGEGPGAREDETGRPFVGRAGELLTDILKAIELEREAVYICNIVKCRPPSNRTPRQEEIDACVPFLHRQLEIVRPEVILAMGSTAVSSLLQRKQSLGSFRGRIHSFRGMPLVATYHPAALLRNPNWKRPTWDDVRIARRILDE
ncbi:uracil-DNA glycosylase [Gemmatimonadota bacterium]